MTQGWAPLNDRQREVLALICQGKHNKDIAYCLGITERTVKWYVSQLFLIFRVSNRTTLALKAQDRESAAPY
jgi:DNA-binding CsgD family transcriptional regulator